MEKINIRLDAQLTIENGRAVLRLCDEVPGAPWYQSGAGKDFFDALDRVEESKDFEVYRSSGHVTEIVVRDKNLNPSWAHE